MKNRNSIDLAIKQEISHRLIGSQCRHLGIMRKVVDSKSYHQIGFNYVDDFDLAEVPVSGPVTTSIEFTIFVHLELDSNTRQPSYASGVFGPVTISYISNGYSIDMSNAVISGLASD